VLKKSAMKSFPLILATLASLSLVPDVPAADAPVAKPSERATASTQTVGKLTLNGASYEGEIRDGNATGNGTLTFGDGRKYVGKFKDNKRHGQGAWTIGGFKYEGGWLNDSYHGQGTETYPKGRKYVGEFKDGYRNGQGIMTLPDSRKFEGEWNRNNYLGPAGTKPAAGGGLAQTADVPKPGSEHAGETRAAGGAADPSLVVWYQFEEGARDSSPNGLHGGIEGTLPWEKGFIGSGAAGCRSGSIRLPDIRDRFANEATLSVWIKMDSAEALGQSIFNFGEGGVEHRAAGLAQERAAVAEHDVVHEQVAEQHDVGGGGHRPAPAA